MSRKLLAFSVIALIGRLESGQTRASFESPRRLITLSVAATGTKGDPVNDLQPADVRVREDGKLQPIVFFRFAGGNRTIAPPAPGQFVNRPVPPLTLILLDRWNERLMTSVSAWHDIDEALQRLESVDRVYIYFLTNRGDLFPVHPLPVTETDARAVSALTPADLVAKLDEANNNVYGLRNRSTVDLGVAADTTFQALSTLLSQMASIAGRKSLIWITHGVPLTIHMADGQWADLTPLVDSLSTGAARSGTAIYTVAQSSEGTGANLASTTLETLQRFAVLTGGRSYSSGSTGIAINEAIADARASYRLAYYPAMHEKDRKEHKIRVETVRKGVHLLTEDRYFAGAVQPNPDEVEESLLSGACRSAFDSTEIGLRVTMSRDGSTGVVRFDIGVDPADVLLERRGERHRGSLDVMIASYTEGFMNRPSPPTHWEVDLSPEQFAESARNGIHHSQTLPVGNDVQKVRVLVFDRELWGLGSLTIPLEHGPKE